MWKKILKYNFLRSILPSGFTHLSYLVCFSLWVKAVWSQHWAQGDTKRRKKQFVSTWHLPVYMGVMVQMGKEPHLFQTWHWQLPLVGGQYKNTGKASEESMPSVSGCCVFILPVFLGFSVILCHWLSIFRYKNHLNLFFIDLICSQNFALHTTGMALSSPSALLYGYIT